jgi:hypothetical protein
MSSEIGTNDYSNRARKPELRRTEWWGWQDSKSHPSDYEGYPEPWMSAVASAAAMVVGSSSGVPGLREFVKGFKRWAEIIY